MTIKNVTVIGAGTMGNGIAHVFAQSGYAVTLVDVGREALDRAVATITNNLARQVKKSTITEDDQKATLGRIKTETQLPASVRNADFVIEAATERFDLKKEIFQTIDANAPEGVIFASNT
ncbi:MAG TPA: 3-hydroxyacyl-CoA dehydrogenase NAD-binding domain-containing protein, partial [Candidatus Kapabacteria bacterium]|nr:3-hydroxyacyl-CoA dehydrogenase NAD-binding domain-containing protein [Candidatus Kapabacteria bacterium]